MSPNNDELTPNCPANNDELTPNCPPVVLTSPFTRQFTPFRRAAARGAEDTLAEEMGESREKHDERLLDRFREDLVDDLSPVGQAPTVLVISAGFLAILYSLDGQEKKEL